MHHFKIVLFNSNYYKITQGHKKLLIMSRIESNYLPPLFLSLLLRGGEGGRPSSDDDTLHCPSVLLIFMGWTSDTGDLDLTRLTAVDCWVGWKLSAKETSTSAGIVTENKMK